MTRPNKIDLVLTYKYDPEDQEIFTEQVEAEKHGDYYRVIHVPAFAKNLAYGDIIEVEYDEDEFHFDALIEESGYSTLHIVIFDTISKSELISNLHKFNCGINSHIAENYLVISIPPATLYHPLRTYLLAQQTRGIIDFRESCLSKIHSSS